jgi:hypothetical protein
VDGVIILGGICEVAINESVHVRFGVKDGWLNNYVHSGLTAEGGGVRVKRAKDVASGKVSWDVYVELVGGACEKKRGWKEWVSVMEKEAGMECSAVGVVCEGEI